MGELPWFKFYPRDWLAGVMALTAEERGIYITLLAWHWDHGPLPSDVPARARLAGVTPGRLKKAWPSLAEHWDERKEGFVNRRMERDRETAWAAHKARVEAGRKGGRKAANPSTNGSTPARAMSKQS